MDIINDFAILATAIAMTYPTILLWRHVVSRGESTSPPALTQQTEVLEQAVRTINGSKNIWTRLSQTEVALKAAKAIGELLPKEAAVQGQITHLIVVRIALANAILRAKVEELWTRMSAEVEVKDKIRQGHEMLRFLEEERRKQSADVRLIDHYYSSIKWYFDHFAQADAIEIRAKDKAAVAHAYQGSLSHLLEKELPEDVVFFDGAEFKLGKLIDSLSKGGRRAVSYSS